MRGLWELWAPRPCSASKGSFHGRRRPHSIASWTVCPEELNPIIHDHRRQIHESPHMYLESGAGRSPRLLADL